MLALALLAEVELDVEHLDELLVLFLHSKAKTSDRVVAVVLDAVIEGELDVIQKLLGPLVEVLGQSLPDGVKVHGFLNNIEVVWNFQFNWVNRLLENPALGHFPKDVEHPAGHFLPRLEKKGSLLHLRPVQLLELGLVLEVLADLGVF